MMRHCHGDLRLFFALCGLLLAPGLNARSEKCEYKDKSSESSAPGNGSDAVCICKEVDRPPWSKKEVNPAPSPENVSLSFEKNPEIHPKIIWLQRAIYMQDVKGGFYMEICVEQYCYFYYNCDVNVERLTKEKEFISFEFDKCCASLLRGDGFREGDQVDVKVHARPMYNMEDRSYYASAEATVPIVSSSENEQKHENQRKHRMKAKKRHHKQEKAAGETVAHIGNATILQFQASSKDEEKARQDEEKAIGDLRIGIAVVGTSLLFCVLGFAAYWRLKRPNHNVQEEEIVQRRILVVGDEGSRSISVLDKIIEVLKKYGRGSTEVVSNRRRVSEIASQGIIRWATRNVAEADIVVFVVTKADQPQLQSYVGVTLGVAENKTMKCGFKSARKKFLVLGAVDSSFLTLWVDDTSLPFCTHYSFSQKDLRMFLQHALGPHYQHPPKREDCSTLKKLYDKNVLRDTGAVTENRSDDIGYSNQLLNNLDKSIPYTSVACTPSVTPNITSREEPPSIENNSWK